MHLETGIFLSMSQGRINAQSNSSVIPERVVQNIFAEADTEPETTLRGIDGNR